MSKPKINKRKIVDIKVDCDTFGVSYEGLKLSISKIGIHLDRNYNSIFNRVSILKRVGKIK